MGFLSRQSHEISEDFLLLGRACQKCQGWSVKYSQCMLDGGVLHKMRYAAHLVLEVKLIAQCRICFVEGYNPALSLLNLESVDLRVDPHSNTPNHTAPVAPEVIQVWHASGMFKKFGFQAVGTPQGRSAAAAELLHMHKNYSWIVCSGESVRPVYAEAFGYPVERVVALGRPSDDDLFDSGRREKARQTVFRFYPDLRSSQKPVILFAPTLRRAQAKRPFDELRQGLQNSSLAQQCYLLWSDHPVSESCDEVSAQRPTTRELMSVAHLVVTDYSSVVYDAALLRLPFAFYVPDISAYRKTPGLNTDPLKQAPGLCFQTSSALATFISKVIQDRNAYPSSQAQRFVGESLSACKPGAAERIVEFAMSKVNDRAAGKVNGEASGMAGDKAGNA